MQWTDSERIHAIFQIVEAYGSVSNDELVKPLCDMIKALCIKDRNYLDKNKDALEKSGVNLRGV